MMGRHDERGEDLHEGAETAAVTTCLLSEPVTRGLPTERTLLFAVDLAQGGAEPSRMSSVLAARCNAAKCISSPTCSSICSNGCTPRSARGCPMPATSSAIDQQRTARQR